MKAVLEKVEVKDEGSIAAFNFNRDRFDAPWHFHPEIELTYILESKGMRYVGNSIEIFTPGDLVLLGSNLPHCWVNDDRHGSRASSLVIQWPAIIFNNIPEFQQIMRLQREAERGLKFTSESYPDIVGAMKAMISESPIKRYISLIEMLESLSIAPKTYLAGASYTSDLSTDTNNKIDQVQSFVANHYHEKIKLLDVASVVNMSEQSFSRFFSKVMNRPFFVFLNEYRVHLASRLLLETDLQVAEIGYKCGYESLPFFYTQFKKFKTYKPLEFRKMYRKI
ncbi:AraC family transcriptional regulator [Reichenbachiella sp.]|uniref:AraC family transcriptional regulator n=1 Tax=Reichenbachiella sp. TaxID=2184521 RepID=UPI003BAE7DE5